MSVCILLINLLQNNTFMLQNTVSNCSHKCKICNNHYGENFKNTELFQCCLALAALHEAILIRQSIVQRKCVIK